MTSPHSLRLYAWLAARPWPRSYAGKLLLAASAGTLAPLALLVAFLELSASPSTGYTGRVETVAFITGMAGTAVALTALHRLLMPVLLAQRGLREYLAERRVPALPTTFTDEAGTLLADTQYAIHQLDDVIRRMATYDDATGLPNRVLLGDRLVQAIALGRRSGHPVALIRLDVTRITDEPADSSTTAWSAVMRALAQRLAATVREVDALARVGDNAFAVVVADASSTGGLVAHVTRLHDALMRALVLDGATVHPRVAVGVAVFPTDATDAEELLQRAGSAVQSARRTGDDVLQFYAPALNAALHDRLAVERDLRRAIGSGELFLEYQPKLELHSGQLAGVEALVRWRHPKRGLMPPVEFIPVADATGLIVPLGAWILEEACRQVQRWGDAGVTVGGRPGIPVAVNLSPRQFTAGGLVATMREIIERTGVDPTLLEVEITERVVAGDLHTTTHLLRDIRALGVAIALDDFGTGYSSLTYLQQLPVDVVKIDRTFITDLGRGRRSAAVTDAVLALAQGLGLRVVAEGVESVEQIDYLRARGCDIVQGFHVAPPLSADAVAALASRPILTI